MSSLFIRITSLNFNSRLVLFSLLGLPENLQQAKELYQHASQGGCQEASKRLKQLQEAEAQRQSQKTQRNSKSKRTLKCNKSQTAIAKPIHMSASEPSLSTTVTISSADAAENEKNVGILKQLSYLALFMPYYYNMGYLEGSPTDEQSEKSPVKFQVGEELEESEMAGLRQVSSPLNSGLSCAVKVS